MNLTLIGFYLQQLLNSASRNPKKYISIFNIVVCSSSDGNIFFDCYNKHCYNKHCYNKQRLSKSFESIKSSKYSDTSAEECKYCRKTNSFKHIMVNHGHIVMTEYKVVDDKKFTSTMAIINLLCRFVNEQMKLLCNDQKRLQQFISSYNKMNNDENYESDESYESDE